MKQNHYQYAWLFVFIPALLYYIFLFSLRVESHWGFLSGLELSQPFLVVGTKGWVDNHALLKQVEAILYVQRGAATIAGSSRVTVPSSTNKTFYTLYHPLESVIRVTDSMPYHFQSLLWRHDPDLGRGYLLISDAMSSGRVWRWEVGGGPITIGRSLFIDKSGCRSGIWNPCPSNIESDWLDRSILKLLVERNSQMEYQQQLMVNSTDCESACSHTPVVLGSSGLALQPSNQHKNAFVGSLLIAELGERRIVRIEENGSRTPIILQVPSLCSDSDTMKRLNAPGILTTTPGGHLLFTEYSTCDEVIPIVGIYRVMDISKIPPLPTHFSHESHAWIAFNQSYLDRSASHNKNLAPEPKIELIFYGNMTYISGLAVSKDMKSVFVGGTLLTTNGELKHAIYRIPLHESTDDLNNIFDDEEEEEEDTEDSSNEQLQGSNCTTDMVSPVDMSCKTITASHDRPKSEIKGMFDDEAVLFFDMTGYFGEISNSDAMSSGPAIAVDSLGNVFATYPGGVLILNCDGLMITSILIDNHINDRIPTSIALGLDDGFLYISTKTSLLRLRTRAKPFLLPSREKRK